MTAQQIQERLDRIVVQGKDPTVSSARKEVLRQWYKFWKHRLNLVDPARASQNDEPMHQDVISMQNAISESADSVTPCQHPTSDLTVKGEDVSCVCGATWPNLKKHFPTLT